MIVWIRDTVYDNCVASDQRATIMLLRWPITRAYSHDEASTENVILWPADTV